MAGDLPPVLIIPLEALDVAGRPAGGAAGEPVGSGAAQHDLTAHEPILFAVAWFIAAGDDRVASHAMADLRARWWRDEPLRTEPLRQALALLVPHACRLARRATPVPTGSPVLDLLFTASARARAASALCDGLGLDEAAAGQVLRVDRFACASYRRHAHGHARFVGVPELVRERFDAEAARARDHGAPVLRPLRLHERYRHEGRIVAVAIAAALVLGTVSARRDPAADDGPPYVLLDAAGWQAAATGIQDPGTVRAVRAYRRAAPEGSARAATLVVYGPRAAVPVLATPDLTTPLTTLPVTPTVSPGVERAGWQPFTVTSAECGRTFAIAHGFAAAEIADSLRTVRCRATGDVAIEPPEGTTEEVVRDPGVPVTTARYVRDRTEVTVLAWRTNAGAEVTAGPDAVTVSRGRRTFVAEPATFGSDLQVRTRLGDALVVVQAPATVGVDALVDLAASARRVGERTFGNAPVPTAPPTTPAPTTTIAARRYAIGALPAGHRIAAATLAAATQPWWRTLGPPAADGAAATIELRVEPAGTTHDVEGRVVDVLVGTRALRVTVLDDARDPDRPERATAVDLHVVWVDGAWQVHLDSSGVPQADVEALLGSVEITDDAARWAAFVEAGRRR